MTPPACPSARRRGPDARVPPGELTGVKIGLLENGKQNARRFLEDVADVLRERYGAGEVQLRRKEIFSQPAPPELVDELSSESDVVVIGIGD